jgi:RNA polymerase sigma-70 factor (ECF subfamily)
VLAARLAAGDDHALAEVFDTLGHSVYGSALRVLGDNSAAQDIVQEVFVELWRHPGRYDPAVGTLRTYLTVLARHRAVDLVRSELRRVARQERSYRLTPAPLVADADVEVVIPPDLDVSVTGDPARAAAVLAAAATVALD